MQRRRRLAVALWALALAGACRSRTGGADAALLVERLKSQDRDLSGQASLDIIRLGEPAAPALGEMLADPEPRLRETAARTLWGMGPKGKAAVPALAGALKDPEASVRTTSAMALENMGPAAASAVSALVAALQDPDGQVRQWAARALGAIGPAARSALPELKKAARVDGVREPAEEAIRKISGQ